MIRAALGRFFQHCIEQARRAEFRAKVDRIDPATLTDQQLSDLVHGRTLNPAVPEGQAALMTARRQLRRVS